MLQLLGHAGLTLTAEQDVRLAHCAWSQATIHHCWDADTADTGSCIPVQEWSFPCSSRQCTWSAPEVQSVHQAQLSKATILKRMTSLATMTKGVWASS